MTDGGPADATLTYVLYLYRNAFEFFKMGYACALAWVLFFILLICFGPGEFSIDYWLVGKLRR